MTVTEGARLALPVAAADLTEGAVYGVAAAAAGLGVVKPVLASLLVFSGSAQFAALTVSSGGGGLAAVLLAVTALNARYLAYGASVAPALSAAPVRRVLEAHVLTDAAWLLGTRGG